MAYLRSLTTRLQYADLVFPMYVSEVLCSYRYGLEPKPPTRIMPVTCRCLRLAFAI